MEGIWKRAFGKGLLEEGKFLEGNWHAPEKKVNTAVCGKHANKMRDHKTECTIRVFYDRKTSHFRRFLKTLLWLLLL